MSDPALFGIGSIVFIFLTWATLMFLYWRFNEVYRSDQVEVSQEQASTVENDAELLSAPKQAAP